MIPEEIRQGNSLIEIKKRIKLWEPEDVCTLCRLCKAYINNLGFI